MPWLMVGPPPCFQCGQRIAVEAFLRNRIGFLQISDIIDHSLSTSSNNQMHSIAELLDLDSQVRQLASARVEQLA